VLMESLWAAGSRVQAYDPVASTEAARLYAPQCASGELAIVESASAALQGADALAIVTEWQEFRSPDFEGIHAALKHAVIFDGRNLYDPAIVERFGLRYFAIGRGESVRKL
jgi:UDPglucose 6-dehydrogenase